MKNTTSKRKYFNAYFNGVAFINKISLRNKADGSTFYSIELGVRVGEKSNNDFRTTRLSAIAVGSQAKSMCEAILNKVDFSINTIKTEDNPEGRESISCKFKASGITPEHYHVGNDVITYLSGRCVSLEHVYIDNELFTLEEKAAPTSESISESVELFLKSISGLENIELDEEDPMLSHYVTALVSNGYTSKGNIFEWTPKS